MRYTPENSNAGSDKCDGIPMDFPSFRNIPSWRFVSIPGQSVSILNDSVIKHPDVAAALELLKPYQATLVEAARFYIKNSDLIRDSGKLRISKPNYFNPKD